MASRREFLGSAGTAVSLFAGTGRATRVEANEGLIGGQVQEKIIGTFVALYQEVPDEPRERYAGVWELSREVIDVAGGVLAQVPAIDEVADLEDFGESIVGLLRNITENLAAVYDIDIKTKYLDMAVRSAGYLPLLAQIWSLLEASIKISDIANTKHRFIQEALHTDTGKTAVKRFYIAILLLLTELVFLYSGVGYRTAFGATRRAANFGLVRIRGRVGLRAYSVLLSIVHWLVRGSFETTVSYIVEKTGEVSQELSLSSSHFSPLSSREIYKVLPQKTSSPISDLGISEYLSFDTQVESATNSVVDSSTKTALIERYGDSGIIEAKNTEADENDWIPW